MPPTLISPASGKWSTPSSPRRTKVTSTLVAVLDPDVVLRSDGGTAHPEVSVVLHGAAAVAGQALTLAQPSAPKRPALVNGAAGVVVTVGGQLYVVMGFTVSRGKIVEIDAIIDPERLRRLDLPVLGD